MSDRAMPELIATRAVMRCIRSRASALARQHGDATYNACVAAMVEQLYAGALKPEQIESWQPGERT